MHIIKWIIEFLFSIGLFINAMLFIPQIIKLLKVKNSEGISLIMFGGFCFIQLLTILHAIIHHDVILLVGYLVSLGLCGFLTGLIVFYRVRKK